MPSVLNFIAKQIVHEFCGLPISSFLWYFHCSLTQKNVYTMDNWLQGQEATKYQNIVTATYIIKRIKHKFKRHTGWVGVGVIIQKVHTLDTAKFEGNKGVINKSGLETCWEAPKVSWTVELGDVMSGPLPHSPLCRPL